MGNRLSRRQQVPSFVFGSNNRRQAQRGQLPRVLLESTPQAAVAKDHFMPADKATRQQVAGQTSQAVGASESSSSSSSSIYDSDSDC